MFYKKNLLHINIKYKWTGIATLAMIGKQWGNVMQMWKLLKYIALHKHYIHNTVHSCSVEKQVLICISISTQGCILMVMFTISAFMRISFYGCKKNVFASQQVFLAACRFLIVTPAGLPASSQFYGYPLSLCLCHIKEQVLRFFLQCLVKFLFC